jgi:LMBR1 domain-containing protein 1
MGLMMGKQRVFDERLDVNMELERHREQQRSINSKYLGGKKMSKSDETSLGKLREQERMLGKRNEQITQLSGGCSRFCEILRPFYFVFGILVFLLSLFLIVTIVLTSISQLYDQCGAPCGFVMKYPTINNPIDNYILLPLAAYFPLDFALFTGLILFIFFSTVGGIVAIGIRFLWVHMYSIRARKTAPQGLLLATMIIMLVVMALNVEMYTIAPQYTQFGTQQWPSTANGTTTWKPCCLPFAGTNSTEPDENCPPAESDTIRDYCTMTALATFVNGIKTRMTYFGMAFYVLNWAFVAAFIIGAIIAGFRSRRANTYATADDDDW